MQGRLRGWRRQFRLTRLWATDLGPRTRITGRANPTGPISGFTDVEAEDLARWLRSERARVETTIQVRSPTSPTTRRGAAQAAEDAQSWFVDAQAGRLGLQSHGRAPSVRGRLGLGGAAFESAHIMPQAVGRLLKGYSPGRALTALLPRATHRSFDQGWVSAWNAAIRSGQRITAGDMHTMLVAAIDRVPNTMLSPAAKGTLSWRVHMEMFGERGLNPSTVLVPGTPRMSDLDRRLSGMPLSAPGRRRAQAALEREMASLRAWLQTMPDYLVLDGMAKQQRLEEIKRRITLRLEWAASSVG